MNDGASPKIAVDPRVVTDVTALLSAFQKLVANLAEADGKLAADGHPMNAYQSSLQAIRQFLNFTPAMLHSGVGKALRLLQNDLMDTVHGGRPPALFGSPNSSREEKWNGGRKPVHQHSGIMRGLLVVALKRLTDAGMERDAAARWMEQQLMHRRVHYEGERITHAMLIRWRYRQGHRAAPRITDTTIAVFSRDLDARFPRQPPLLEEAKRAAETVILVASLNSH